MFFTACSLESCAPSLVCVCTWSNSNTGWKKTYQTLPEKKRFSSVNTCPSALMHHVWIVCVVCVDGRCSHTFCVILGKKSSVIFSCIHRPCTVSEWAKVFQPVKTSFSPPVNDPVNEWKYYTGIFSTSPLPVWHHGSRAGGARWLWHISILATDGILLACRSENKTTFMDTRCCLFVCKASRTLWQIWHKLSLRRTC